MEFADRLNDFARELAALNLTDEGDSEYRDALIGHIEGTISCCGHESCMKQHVIEFMAAFACDCVTHNVNKLTKDAAIRYLESEKGLINVGQ